MLFMKFRLSKAALVEFQSCLSNAAMSMHAFASGVMHLEGMAEGCHEELPVGQVGLQQAHAGDDVVLHDLRQAHTTQPVCQDKGRLIALRHLRHFQQGTPYV